MEISPRLMDKWTSPWRFVSLQLVGQKAEFDGQVTGNLSFNLNGNKSVFDGHVHGDLCL